MASILRPLHRKSLGILLAVIGAFVLAMVGRETVNAHVVLPNGATNIVIDGPIDATLAGFVNGRFHLFDPAQLPSGSLANFWSGLAHNGEVEDYQDSLSPTAVSLSGNDTADDSPNDTNGLLAVAIGVIVGGLLGHFLSRKRKRRTT